MTLNSFFCEGCAYNLLGDSLCARKAYTKSLQIYDSLIAKKSSQSDMINRATIIQILYGMEAYNKALEEIQSNYPKDSITLRNWRNFRFKAAEIHFGELKEIIP